MDKMNSVTGLIAIVDIHNDQSRLIHVSHLTDCRGLTSEILFICGSSLCLSQVYRTVSHVHHNDTRHATLFLAK